MDQDPVKDVKKHKMRWVGFFAVAILAACMGNIINCIYLLVVLKTLYLDSMTLDAVRGLELKAVAATGVVLVSLAMYLFRLPRAVRTWEYKEWGKKFAIWLAVLFSVSILFTLVFMNSAHSRYADIQAFLLLVNISLNFLVAWYFSRSKIKSIFVK